MYSNPEVNQAVLNNLLHQLDRTQESKSAAVQPEIRRIIMKSPTTKLAAAAVLIAVVTLLITVIDRTATPAYAIGQTVEALENVRFIHLVGYNDAGQIKDERWIEIGMDGRQVRYRQDTPPQPFAIEDGESTARYRHDKKAVVMYDRKDLQYQLIGNLGEALENLRQEGVILKENDSYKGRPAHKVWWPYLSAECYVDPESKLPVAMGDAELSYEDPPSGIFDIFVPEGYIVVDMRPGADNESVPDWLKEEVNIQEMARECFRQGTHSLASSDYAEAAELFEFVTKHQSGRNWAWFWLGSAYYGQGKYQSAIENFTKVLEMFKAHGGGDEPVNYCNYARGLAYAQLEQQVAAKADLQVCLPSMIRTLRIPSAGKMFEYAENPLIRYGEYEPTESQMVSNMINRLRLITGQNFGYDPDAGADANDQAIAAWEQWFENSGEIRFTPDAELISVQ